MGWRFRRKIRVFPGFYINLSKSGMSATIGMRGLSVNLGQNGMFLNTGIPGTGIYSRERIGDAPRDGKKNMPIAFPEAGQFTQSVPYEAVEIKSFVPELLTSDSLFGLKESVVNAQEEKNNLRNEYKSAKSQYDFSKKLLVISYIFIIGLFVKWFKKDCNTKKQDAEDVKKIYEEYKLKIDFDLEGQILNEYILVENYFDMLSKSIKIWDITVYQDIDKVKARSAASSNVARTLVSLERAQLDYINTKYVPLKFNNANGGSLYIYPGFITMPSKTSNAFALIDFRDLRFEHHIQRFVEEEGVPSDSQVVDQTWRYVNKNGSPDKRFNNNYQIPIVQYYEINFKTDKGLNESYQISNVVAGQAFANALSKYISSLQKLKWSSMVKSDVP